MGMKVLQNLQKFRALWHGRTELTEVPGGYEICCTRTPGIVARVVQNSQKFRYYRLHLSVTIMSLIDNT